jgi:homocitrate synthase NifV
MSDRPAERPDAAWIVDSTLREGEQAPGVVFSPEDRLAIARGLESIGVRELELGTPAMGREEMELIREVVDLGLSCRLTAWCRAVEDDVDRAALCRVDGVHISLPASDIFLRSMGKDRNWVLERIGRMVPFARLRVYHVSIGVQDAARADRSFLVECAAAARRAGANRFRLSDTLGIWNPLAVRETIEAIGREVPDLRLGFHGHDDLGMATANSIAAVQAGAESVDVTVNGIGERAGIAPLEEVVMALQVSLGKPTGIRTEGLQALSALVARASGIPLPPGKAITGRDAFRHEAGVHVRALLADRVACEPFPPEEVGHPPSDIVLGRHSGSTAIRHVLEGRGIRIGRDEAARLVAGVRAAAARRRSPLPPEELVSLWRASRLEEAS